MGTSTKIPKSFYRWTYEHCPEHRRTNKVMTKLKHLSNTNSKADPVDIDSNLFSNLKCE